MRDRKQNREIARALAKGDEGYREVGIYDINIPFSRPPRLGDLGFDGDAWFIYTGEWIPLGGEAENVWVEYTGP